MPCATPGTPCGNTALRSPGSFFLVLKKSPANHSVGSSASPMLAQPPSGSTITEVTRTMRASLVIACPSRAAAGSHERAQHLNARACRRRRLNVGDDEIEPALGASGVACAPGRKRQKLARRVAIGAALRRQRLEPRARLVIGAGIDLQRTRAQAGEVAPCRADGAVVSDLLIGREAELWIALGQLGGLPHAGEIAIARGAVSRDLGIGALGLG